MNKQSLIYHNDTFLGKILKKKSYQFFKVPNNIYKFNECKSAYKEILGLSRFIFFSKYSESLLKALIKSSLQYSK